MDENGVIESLGKIVDSLCKMRDDDNLEGQHNRQYNRIARDQPAYISLLFPIGCVIMILHDSPWWNRPESIWMNIFSCIALSTLFLPALFFLYKQIIRALSELLIEEIIFRLISPVWVLYHISKDDMERLREKWGGFSIPDAIKSSSKGLKVAIRHMRELDYIRNNRIVFENNCVYGFFRNLAGGCALNLTMYYICIHFISPAYMEIMHSYFDVAIPALWSMAIVTTIMAWGARYRHLKREMVLFIDHTDNPN